MDIETLEVSPDRISDPNFFGQSTPVIASLTNGGWVIAWQSYDQDGEDFGIFARVYSAEGEALGEEFQVNAYTAHNQGYPSLIPLNDGGWIVAWQSSEQDGDRYGIYGKRYLADGAALDTEFRINTYTFEAQQRPSLAPLEDGGWVATWFSRQDGSNASVHGQIFSQEGVNVGAEFQINTHTESAQELPDVAALKDGGFIVTWVSHLQDGENGGIFGQRYSSSGVKVGSEFQINEYAAGWQQDQSVSALSDGGWIVAWSSENPNGSGTVIFAKRYDANGAELVGEFEIESPVVGYQGAPETVGNFDGGWAVVWTSTTPDGSKSAILMQRYLPNGEPQGEPIKIVDATSHAMFGGLGTSSITSNPDGSWVVAWQGADGIFSQFISADGQLGFVSNKAPSGNVDLHGTAAEGQTLTAITDTVADDDGLGEFSYQWLRDGNEINGATQSSYTLTQEDVGTQISLSVSYTDGGGTVESVSSGLTAPVEAAPVIDPAFDIALASTSGNVATFEVYATESADSGDPGLEDFQFVLSHDVADMTIDAASISSATGLTAFPNFDVSMGSLTFGGFALPPFTDLSTPVLTFEATILNEETPLTIAIDDVVADNADHPRIEEQFDFSSVEISTTVTDRFGNPLSDAVVSAYEVQLGDELFLREVGTSDTSSVFEIVARPTEAVSSIDFDLLDNVGLIDFQVGSALSGWSVQSNTNTPDTVSFAGFGAVDGSQDLVAGQETVLATFTTSIDPDFVIDGIFLNTTAQADISVGEIPAASKTGNVTVHQVSRGSDVYLDADKPIDAEAEDAITANDALQALRLAVGLTKSDGTAEWHDYIAADINMDGQVTANDALNILKFAVGLTDGPSADWVFVDGDADWGGIGRRDTNYEEGVWLENVLADTSVNMTGILVGDVNGSYIA